MSLASAAFAHEYWLDPLGAAPVAGGGFVAAVRNGEDFAGSSLPFDPARMTGLELVGPDGHRPIPARIGDFPAVRTTLGPAGDYLVRFDTYGKELVYDELEKFAAFLDYHGQDGVLAAHAERGLPERNIREHYFRHVKTLLSADAADAADAAVGAEDATSAVGGTTPDADAAGAADASTTGTPEEPGVFEAQGQALELVPENDPLVDDELAARLLEDGEPVANAQVELFERTPSGEVSRRVARTDTEGGVRFDVSRAGDYLVNAVRVKEPGEEALASAGPTPHWQSRWASLTFDKR